MRSNSLNLCTLHNICAEEVQRNLKMCKRRETH